MAYPSSQLDSVKNPQTRCSNCQTVFEVSRDLLISSDTRVRCGECLSIFDALQELHTGTGLAADSNVKSHQHSGADSNEALDVTYADFDLFSANADLPEIAYFDQTRDTPDFNFEAVELGNDETFSDTLFVHDVTIDADATTLRTKPSQPELTEIEFIDDGQPSEPLIFNYRDADEPVNDVGNGEVELTQPSTSVKKSTTTNSVSVTSSKLQSSVATGVSSKATNRVVLQSSADAVASTNNKIVTSAESFDSVENFQSNSQVVEQVNQQNNEQKSLDSTIAAEVAPVHQEVQDVELESVQKSKGSWLFRFGMFAILLALLGALLGYRMQPQLYNNSSVRPVLEFGCKLLRCTIPARVDIDSLKIVKRNVYSHPNKADTLIINVSFRNDAEFAQRLPALSLVLSNRVGRAVTSQNFVPPSYYPGWNESIVIDAKEQLDVKLEIEDPGSDAQSFEFIFREYNP